MSDNAKMMEIFPPSVMVNTVCTVMSQLSALIKTIVTAGSKVPRTMSFRSFQSQVWSHIQCVRGEEAQCQAMEIRWRLLMNM